MTNSPQIDQELLNVLLRWHPWPVPDPALGSIIAQIDEAARREVVVASLELHKEILAAQMKAADRVIAALSKQTPKTP